MHVPKETPLGEGLPEWFPAGRMRTLLIGQKENVEIPVVSRQAAMRGLDWEFGEGDSFERGFVVPYSGEPTSAYAGMLAAKAGEGAVVIATRFMFNMNGYTGRWSDKPISKPYELEANRQFEHNFVKYVAAISSGEHAIEEFIPLSRTDRIPENEKPESLEDMRFLSRPLHETAPENSFDELEPFELVAPSQLSLVDEAKVKSGFDHQAIDKSDDIDKLDKYEKMGINLLYIMYGRQLYRARDDQEGMEEEKDKIRTFLGACKERGIKVMIGGASPERIAWWEQDYPTSMVDGTGRAYDVPAPFDEESWRHTVVEPGKVLAELAKEFPETLVGCFWDLELYAHGELVVSEAVPFDTGAWQKYLDERRGKLRRMGLLDAAAGLEQKRRWRWLEEHGLLKDYYAVMEDVFYRMVKDTIQTFDDIKENFEWGFYTAGIPQSWYYRGLYRAVQEYQGEVLVATYEARGQQQASYYQSMGINLVHVPGVLMGIPEDEEWVEFLTMSMENESGYWLFPIGMLEREENWRALRNDEALNQHPREIVDLVEKANDQFPPEG
jgi:hypothetical protein